MKAKRLILGLWFFSVLLASVSSQAQTPQQMLQQCVADLQKNPGDDALRGKIVALVQTMKPAPAIPPKAREDFVMAATFVETAKSDDAGYEHAIEHYKAALLAAPWWADARQKIIKLAQTLPSRPAVPEDVHEG